MSVRAIHDGTQHKPWQGSGCKMLSSKSYATDSGAGRLRSTSWRFGNTTEIFPIVS